MILDCNFYVRYLKRNREIVKGNTLSPNIALRVFQQTSITSINRFIKNSSATKLYVNKEGKFRGKILVPEKKGKAIK